MKSLAIVLFAVACGGGGSTPDKDAAVVIDSPHSTGDAPHGDATAADAPAGPTLRIKNFDAWCSVIVDGHPASAAAVQDVAVTAGTINVSAVALQGFQLGTKPWHNTSGDTGSGEQGTITGSGQTASSATTVVVGASGKCAWVCCEFTGGGGCPTTDQCP